MTTHTPGPWEWWTSCSWKRLTSKDAAGRWMQQGNVLCPSIASDGHPVLDVSEADMSLIAAAPDLLEALKLAYAALSRPDIYTVHPVGYERTVAHDAIAKAKAQS